MAVMASFKLLLLYQEMSCPFICSAYILVYVSQYLQPLLLTAQCLSDIVYDEFTSTNVLLLNHFKIVCSMTTELHDGMNKVVEYNY